MTNLKLVAISWSGKEGNFLPYVWDGWTPHDGFLDWPRFRDRNHLFWAPLTSLGATFDPINNSMDLSWTPNPQGCTQPENRPFVVYRKRGSATRWAQISPPFVCATSTDTVMSFRDTDVEPGMTYTYTVVRQDADGEFSMQFGPQAATVP